MNEENLKDEIKDNIAYNRSSLDCIYSTPIDEGGMEMLEQQIGEITFYEDRIEEDLEDLYILEKRRSCCFEILRDKLIGLWEEQILTNITSSIYAMKCLV